MLLPRCCVFGRAAACFRAAAFAEVVYRRSASPALNCRRLSSAGDALTSPAAPRTPVVESAAATQTPSPPSRWKRSSDKDLDPPLWTQYPVECYQKRLPNSSCAWDSFEGRTRFKAAILDGTAACYFRLFCSFESQSDPATCGPGTLAIVLKALGLWEPDRSRVSAEVDRAWLIELFERALRGRSWKHVLTSGTTVDEFMAAAAYAGANVSFAYAGPDVSPYASFASSESEALISAGGSLPLAALDDPAVPFPLPPIRAAPCSPTGGGGGPDGNDKGLLTGVGERPLGHISARRLEGPHGEDVLRAAIMKAARTAEGSFLAFTYSRYALNQTGDGHFSPLGAYHAETDSVLVLEPAKFKYPPHWIPLKLLWRAMQRTDWSTGRPRGFMLLSAPQARG